MILTCDSCGANTRRPAIDLALSVLCPKCAPGLGMDPGEHSPHRSYDEWKRLAAEAQARKGTHAG